MLDCLQLLLKSELVPYSALQDDGHVSAHDYLKLEVFLGKCIRQGVGAARDECAAGACFLTGTPSPRCRRRPTLHSRWLFARSASVHYCLRRPALVP